MSQHGRREKDGPSWAVIGAAAVTVLSAMGATIWVATGPDSSELIGGVVLGTLFFLSLTAKLAGLLAERQAVLVREQRARDVARMIQEREIWTRSKNTGTWQGDQIGQAMTIRYEPVSATWWVQGWMSDFWQLAEETEWTWPVDSLINAVREHEASGELRPMLDQGTTAVRERLGLPSARVMAEEADEISGLDHWAYDDTSVMEVPGAALDRLSMPVPRFTTEWERDAWLREQDETQVIDRG